MTEISKKINKEEETKLRRKQEKKKQVKTSKKLASTKIIIKVLFHPHK